MITSASLRKIGPTRLGREVTVKAGDVHRQMKLTNRMPAVCEALRSKILQSRCGVRLVEWSGPEQARRPGDISPLREKR